MNDVLAALAWLFSPENYLGAGSIPQRVAEHLGYTAVAVASAAMVALPLGYAVGHTGRGRFAAFAGVGAARALPSFGLLLLLVLWMGVERRELGALVAMAILAAAPLLAAAYSGIGQIDHTVLDAARSQGMTEWQVFWRVELPLSLPVVVGGLRSAILQVIATVPLVAYVGLGGLGYDLLQGIPLRRFDQVIGSAVLVALLALLVDGVVAGLGKRLTPRGVRTP